MASVVGSTPKPEPREFYKFPTVGGYLERVRTAALDRVTTATLEWGDWYESDEWRKRFGSKVMIIPLNENKAYLEVLRDTGLEIDEIFAFMTPYPSSPRWARKVLFVERFCEGADFSLRNFVPDDAGSSRLQDTQESKAWVSDHNLVLPRTGRSRRAYGRIVNNIELYEIVQQKNWWGASNFVISINLPFFAIGTLDDQDIRTFSGNQYLRSRYDLDFLYLRDQASTQNQQDNSDFHDKAVLHEAVYSLMITGRSERYWTAVCLDDDFFDEIPRLEEEGLEGSVDPIIIQAELKARGTTRSPRAYALAALEKELEKVVEYHGDVQDWFTKSLDGYTNISRGDGPQGISTQQIQDWEERFPDMLDKIIYFNSSIFGKVNEFLAGHIMLGPKESFQGPLWQGLQGDYGALGSLRGIKSSCSQLSDIGDRLKLLKEKEKVFRREVNSYLASHSTPPGPCTLPSGDMLIICRGKTTMQKNDRKEKRECYKSPLRLL
ncbi:hypothetical protein IL306_006980 [Fusarium sp. DS 682]|nr:hypothetical protein IL306_006980 [Fusarium sp. DS 682]